eukprot:1593680-Lingulodinium_polyedra.AAC.1
MFNTAGMLERLKLTKDQVLRGLCQQLPEAWHQELVAPLPAEGLEALAAVTSGEGEAVAVPLEDAAQAVASSVAAPAAEKRAPEAA